MEKLKIKHYRYERFYPFDDDGLPVENENPSIILMTFETLRETPGGYWIKIGETIAIGLGLIPNEKFVLKDSNKRYAYPTKKEAFNSFTIRTRKSLSYAKRDLKNAKHFLKLVNETDIDNLK